MGYDICIYLPISRDVIWCLPPRSVATSVKGLFRVHRPCAVAMGREATRRDPIHLASAWVEARFWRGGWASRARLDFQPRWKMSTIFMQLIEHPVRFHYRIVLLCCYD